MLGAFIMHPKTALHPTCRQRLRHSPAGVRSASEQHRAQYHEHGIQLAGVQRQDRSGDHASYRAARRSRTHSLINLGMDHHPIHLHGHTFYTTGTEGGRIPTSAWMPGNTVLVGVAQSRDVEFVANNPGDWMLHCHMPHHMMNQMSSNVGPMSRKGAGMPPGVDMNQGMGMLNGAPELPWAMTMDPASVAVSESAQPTINRGKRTRCRPELNGHARNGSRAACSMAMNADVAPNANRVPGFPQDAYMEGPMMAMDKTVEKPQNYGLRPGWSGFMQGMMSFVRVLPPDQYDKVMEQVRKGNQDMSGTHHPM